MKFIRTNSRLRSQQDSLYQRSLTAFLAGWREGAETIVCFALTRRDRNYRGVHAGDSRQSSQPRSFSPATFFVTSCPGESDATYSSSTQRFHARNSGSRSCLVGQGVAFCRRRRSGRRRRQLSPTIPILGIFPTVQIARRACIPAYFRSRSRFRSAQRHLRAASGYADQRRCSGPRQCLSAGKRPRRKNLSSAYSTLSTSELLLGKSTSARNPPLHDRLIASRRDPHLTDGASA